MASRNDNRDEPKKQTPNRWGVDWEPIEEFIGDGIRFEPLEEQPEESPAQEAFKDAHQRSKDL